MLNLVNKNVIKVDCGSGWIVILRLCLEYFDFLIVWLILWEYLYKNFFGKFFEELLGFFFIFFLSEILIWKGLWFVWKIYICLFVGFELMLIIEKK